jgi:hypothetical protein
MLFVMWTVVGQGFCGDGSEPVLRADLLNMTGKLSTHFLKYVYTSPVSTTIVNHVKRFISFILILLGDFMEHTASAVVSQVVLFLISFMHTMICFITLCIKFVSSSHSILSSLWKCVMLYCNTANKDFYFWNILWKQTKARMSAEKSWHNYYCASEDLDILLLEFWHECCFVSRSGGEGWRSVF